MPLSSTILKRRPGNSKLLLQLGIERLRGEGRLLTGLVALEGLIEVSSLLSLGEEHHYGEQLSSEREANRRASIYVERQER